MTIGKVSRRTRSAASPPTVWVLLLVSALLAGCAAQAEPTLRSTPATTALPTEGPTDAATAAPASALEARLRPLLVAAAEDAQAGAAVAVITPDGSWAGGAGIADADSGRPVTAETTFAIASNTKPVVAALILRLAEDGQLDIDRPIAEYLPGNLALLTNRATVREVLGHRSGIGEHGSEAFKEAVLDDAERTWSPSDTFRYVGPVTSVAGTRFGYSNTNYVLLDILIETVTGQPTGEVMSEMLLEPHGIERMVYQPTSPPPEPIAVGHADLDGDGRLAPLTGGDLLPTRALATAAGGAGGMAGDAPSLARWARLLYGGNVLDPASLDAMLDFSAPEGPPYGLGTAEYRFRDVVAVGHGGGIPGFSSVVLHAPEADVTVALLFNADLVGTIEDPVLAARPFLEAALDH